MCTYLYVNVRTHHVPLCLRVQSPLAVTCWLHVLLCSPRPPLPLSAIMTEEEAATLIQAGYRGYRVSARASTQRLQCMSVDVKCVLLVVQDTCPAILLMCAGSIFIMSFVYHNPMQVRCKDDVQVFRQWLKGYRKVMWAARTLQLSLTHCTISRVVACVVIMPLPRGICRKGLPVGRFRDFGGLPNIPHTTPQRKV